MKKVIEGEKFMKKILLSSLCVAMLCLTMQSNVFAMTPVEAKVSAQKMARGTLATFICTGDYVNVRKGPSTSYASVGQMMKGDVGIIGAYNSTYTWANLNCTTAHLFGWSSISYLKLGEP